MAKLEHGRGDLHLVESEAQLAEGLADIFVDEAKRAIEARATFNVALAGGTTPKAAYELLAQDNRRRQVDWDRVHVFFGDERCVPPDHTDSNYRMAKLALLDHVGLPPEHVHRMRGEIDPQVAAGEYAALLRSHLGEQPAFDLIMLGMGPDGHTASLFPGTDPETDTGHLVRAPYVEKFSTFRITFTPHVINAAHRVVITTGGASKTDAVHAVLQGNYSPIDYPIQIVHPQSGKLTWLVDRAAAAKL